MKVTFPGGKKVDAEFNGHHIHTDQSVQSGGEGTAPEPFDLFLAALATCAGIYIKGFCDQRNLDASDVQLIQNVDFDPVTRMLTRIHLDIQVPSDFPEKYDGALIKTASLCKVKKHLQPEIQFEGRVTRRP